MWFGLVSLFPEIFCALHSGITGRALKDGLIQLEFFNPRDFTDDIRQTVDDRPYGGGPGMLMKAEPLLAALAKAKGAAHVPATVIYLSPQGKPFTQPAAENLKEKKALILLSGRYEGIDERIVEEEIDEEWSIGDYILTGGELPSMVMIDVITRLIPYALGAKESAAKDSLAEGLLKYPNYTRPQRIGLRPVPNVLLSGHHQQIRKWRLKQSLGRTWLKRPDLLAKKKLTNEESLLLNEFMIEFMQNNARKIDE